MFPFRYSSIFRNRWMALLWAAGICWTAVDFAGGRHDDGDGNAVATDASGAPASDDPLQQAADAMKKIGG